MSAPYRYTLPLVPTRLAVRIRDICNHWPQYSHMRNIPAHSACIRYEEEFGLEEAHDKQAYYNSLHQVPRDKATDKLFVSDGPATLQSLHTN